MTAHRGPDSRLAAGRRPAPLRSAAPFAALSALSATLLPTAARPAGAIAAGLFASAAAVQAWSEHRLLDRVRAAADGSLLRAPGGHFPAHLAWRAGEVGSARHRERVARDLRHAVRADGGPHARELEVIARRLEGPAPVDVRGVLLARRLLPTTDRHPAGAAGPREIAATVRRVCSLVGVPDGGTA